MGVDRWTWIAASVVAGMAGAGLQQAGQAPAALFDSLGSRAVPYFVSAALLVLVVLMVAEESLQKQSNETGTQPSGYPAQRSAKALWRCSLGVSMLFIYVAVLSLTDNLFWLTTLIFVFAMGCVLSQQGAAGWRLNALVAFLTATGVQAVFSLMLIDLP